MTLSVFAGVVEDDSAARGVGHEAPRGGGGQGGIVGYGQAENAFEFDLK